MLKRYNFFCGSHFEIQNGVSITVNLFYKKVLFSRFNAHKDNCTNMGIFLVFIDFFNGAVLTAIIYTYVTISETMKKHPGVILFIMYRVSITQSGPLAP